MSPTEWFQIVTSQDKLELRGWIETEDMADKLIAALRAYQEIMWPVVAQKFAVANLVPCLHCGSPVEPDTQHWEFGGYDKTRGGYAARARCINLSRGDAVAWFVIEDDARQYVQLMNVVNPNHNSPGHR